MPRAQIESPATSSSRFSPPKPRHSASPADDLREVSFQTKEPSGSSVLVYHRYVGDLVLKDASFVAVVDRNGTLSMFTGYIVPLPPALFDAAARPTLEEGEVRAIAAAEQVKQAADPNAPMAAEKFAVSEPPYVVWRVGTVPWVYRIDAFSGAILEKTWGPKFAR